MAVYVDNMRARYGRMVMCHMVADSSEELHAMADRIGVSRRWCQHAGTYREHYDICLSKRTQAIKAGAKAIGFQEFGTMLLRRQRNAPASAVPTKEGR